jgi:hypothetical protein
VTSLTFRIVTFGAVTMISPVTVLFSYTWPAVDSVTVPVTAWRAMPGLVPVFSRSG